MCEPRYVVGIAKLPEPVSQSALAAKMDDVLELTTGVHYGT